MASIDLVGNGELIRTTWGNSVADELNIRTLKNNLANQVATGPLIIVGNPTLRLRHSANSPAIAFENQASPFAEFGRIRCDADLMNFIIFAAGSAFHWYVGGTEIATLSSGGALTLNSNLNSATGTFARNDGTPQLIVSDYSGTTAGVTARAFVGFYPDAANATSGGTRKGYVGFNGAGLRLTGDVGNTTVESTSGSVDLTANTAININAGAGVVLKSTSPASTAITGGFAITHDIGTTEVHRTLNGVELFGKTTHDDDIVGTEIFTNTFATTTVRNSIRNTVGAAGIPNLYCRRISTAVADNQVFVDFTRDTGTRIGSISQNGTSGVTYGTTSDYRLKNDLGPVDDPIGKVRGLAPKALEWKDGSGTFDGFIAHEVAAVVPNAVSGQKDAVMPPDDPGNPGGIDPQQLDLGQLVPVLTAALQQALTTIDDLTARVTALEGGVTT